MYICKYTCFKCSSALKMKIAHFSLPYVKECFQFLVFYVKILEYFIINDKLHLVLMSSHFSAAYKMLQ